MRRKPTVGGLVILYDSYGESVIAPATPNVFTDLHDSITCPCGWSVQNIKPPLTAEAANGFAEQHARTHSAKKRAQLGGNPAPGFAIGLRDEYAVSRVLATINRETMRATCSACGEEFDIFDDPGQHVAGHYGRESLIRALGGSKHPDVDDDPLNESRLEVVAAPKSEPNRIYVVEIPPARLEILRS